MFLKHSVQLFTCAIALLISTQLAAQTTEARSSFYLKMTELNTSNYVDLHKALAEDGKYSIGSACILVHLVRIDVQSTKQTDQEFLRDFQNYSTKAGFKNPQLLENYTDEMFVAKCSEARTGGK